MGTSWPQKRRVIGKKARRLDGPVKATGRAKYSYDVNRPGMLHAQILRSPHAHARVKSINIATAEKMPGVFAIHRIVEDGKEVYYVGDEVIALAADTEEHCLDALRAIKVDYEVLPFLVKEEDALKEDRKTVSPVRGQSNNVGKPARGKSEDFEKGLAAAQVIHEGTYGVPVISHQCLEPHGLVAEWDKDGGLTVWASTQAVTGTADQLAKYFADKGVDLPASKVKCITHYMGGGFGSKFGPDIQGIVAAELARKAGKPVKLMLDREAEVLAAGNRPSAYGKVKIGATKEGKITAYQVECWGTPGIGNSQTVTFTALPYVYSVQVGESAYSVPFSREYTTIRLNTGAQRAMRAPNHPQNSMLTDCPLDDLAAKLGMDPMQLRLKNLPPNDPDAIKTAPTSLAAIRHTLYSRQIEIAAELSKWKDKWHPPGQGKGPIRRGIGMALHTWGGQASPQSNECTVIIAADGSVTARSSTQDLGTGQRTVTAVVVAEVLGLQPEQITVQIGESNFGASSGSGGSTTSPSQAPATLRAAIAARDSLFAKIADKLKAKPEDLVIEEGKVRDKASNKTYEWKQACARLGMEQARGTGNWTFALSREEDNKNVSNVGVGGVQVAEVVVDMETGQVRCTQIVAVQDCGLVLDRLTCESQVAGGVVMGLNYGLFEERIMDRQTGRQVNPNMEFYKLGGIEDMPRIVVHLMDMPERGVIGIGEPPTISTHAAIGNAVFNALGVRVPYTPYTPERVLAALAAGADKGGKS
jgi:xanthine dehydrogenase YagR molybdenum-binding subunit